MHSTVIRGLAIALVLPLAACSTRLTASPEGLGRYTDLPGGNPVAVGADYGLPMLQFQLQVQRTLLQCEDDDSNPKIRFLVKVESQPGYVVGERFTLDYLSLSNWSKTSSFEYQTYDNGTLKSINAEVADQTKAIVGSAIKSGISLLSLAQGIPLVNKAMLPPGAPQPSGHVCTAQAQEALATVESVTGTLKAETSSLTAMTAEVARLERSASMGALTEAAKLALDTAQKDVVKQSKKVAKLEKDLATVVDVLTVSEQLVWPQWPTQTTLNALPNPVNRVKLEGLFEQAPGGYKREDFEATLQLRARLAAVGPVTSVQRCGNDDKDCASTFVKSKDASGLFYRAPVAARLLVCQVSADDDCDLSNAGASGVVVNASVLAPQLGPLRVLPYSNGVFQNNLLKVAFRENGSISTLNYDEKSARGLELAETISSGLDQVTAYRDARQAERERRSAAVLAEADAKTKAELDELDTQIARLQKVKQINQLNAETSNGVALADMETETTKLNAQLALLEARRKVRDAQEALDKP